MASERMMLNTNSKRRRYSSTADLLYYRGGDQMAFLGYLTSSPSSKRRKADDGVHHPLISSSLVLENQQTQSVSQSPVRENQQTYQISLSSFPENQQRHAISPSPVPEKQRAQSISSSPQQTHPTRLAQTQIGGGRDGEGGREIEGDKEGESEREGARDRKREGGGKAKGERERDGKPEGKRVKQEDGRREDSGRNTRKRARSLPSYFASHSITCLTPRKRNTSLPNSSSPSTSKSPSTTATSFTTTTPTSPKQIEDKSTPLSQSPPQSPPHPPTNDVENPWLVPKFHHTEADIKVLCIIGEGLHAIVLRILCGGQIFACKIHKYPDSDEHPVVYPRPNSQFVRESRAFVATQPLQQPATPSQPQIVPRCHGYVKFTRASYAMLKLRHWEAFVIQEDSDNDDYIEPEHIGPYFRKAPRDKCILRGLVLDEITSRPWTAADLVSGSPLFESGRRGLEELHRCGVIHGDVCNLQNALIVKSEATGMEEVMWIDFSLSWNVEKIAKERFERMEGVDFRRWEMHFKEGVYGNRGALIK